MTPALLARLREILGPDGLLTEAADRLAYGYDNSKRIGEAGAVALPRTHEQVEAIMRACFETGTPLVARGRGTNTTGASVPLAGALVLSFERMDRILRIDPGNRLAVIEPGVLNGDLQKALAPHGFFWAPDPTSAPYSTIAGNLACNAGGPRTVKYGACRDNILALRAVDGTGRGFRCGSETTKGATGYDLTRLLVGSEGTLALVTEATLKLTPLAQARRSLRALYVDVAAAARAVARIMGQPVVPCALEFMDGTALRLVRERGAAVPAAGAMLLIEVDARTEALDDACAAVEAAARGAGVLSVDIDARPGDERATGTGLMPAVPIVPASAAAQAVRGEPVESPPRSTLHAALNDGLVDFAMARDAHETETLWSARKALSPALRSIAPTKINEDVVVPVSRLPELTTGLEALSQLHGIPIVCFGHAGNGNIHVNLLYDAADAERDAAAQRCLDAVFDLVIALGGTLSGEHGIGLAKRDWMPKAIDPVTLDLMRAIKSRFDPKGLLNPGKLLPPA
jgi:D-lactate dehydrogenase